MRLRIVHKVFIALLVVSTVSLIVLGGMTHWSLGRGFLHYVNELEKKNFETLAGGLAEEYRAGGGWGSLKNDPSVLFRIIKETWHPEGVAPWRPEHHPPGERMARDGKPHAGRFPPYPHGGRRRIAERMTIYDAAREPIFGHRPPPGQVQATVPIEVDGSIVGWVGYRQLGKLAATQDVDFLRHQLEMLLITLAALVILAAVLALLLARQLSKPIAAITQHIKELAAGKYDTRLIPMSSDELGRLTTDTNHLAAALEQNESARRRWIADVSHELRTPIAVLRGEVEAVQDGIRKNDDDFVHSIGIEVTRLSKLVDDLYQLSMSDVGALNYRFESCSISAVLEETIAGFSGRLDECDITVHAAVEPDVLCRGDKQRLAQLFVNLLENTCRYTEKPGKLMVELGTDGQTISIDLADSGPGITSAEGDRLFDPLYRGERSRSREHGGAGLGLSICRKIVEAHRGTIDARPSVMGGVAIHITLPAID